MEIIPIVTADLEEVFSQQEEFFQNLNLCATKRIRVKYCRTIKERLRATTKEESLSLPSTSRSKLGLSPNRRKPDDDLSLKDDFDETDEEIVKIRGGINVLKSIKRRKSDRSKNITPPSTKSLLSYLQPKLAEDDDLGDSSSVDSDASDAFEPFRLRPISVSVNRLTNRNIASHHPDLRVNMPDLMRRRRVSAAEAKICGFSHEISAATFSKNEQLKNIISDLESEINEKERETFKVVQKLQTIQAGGWSSSLVPRENIRQQLMKDFRIASSESSGTDDDILPAENIVFGGTNVLDHHLVMCPGLNPGDTFSDIVESKSDIAKLTDISVDTLKSELSETEISGIKTEFVHEAVDEEYSEFTSIDRPPAVTKAEFGSPVDFDSKLFQASLAASSVLGSGEMCKIHEAPLKPEVARLDDVIEIYEMGQEILEKVYADPPIINLDASENPQASSENIRKIPSVLIFSEVEGKDVKKKVNTVRPRKRLKEKYKKMFLEKQLLLLENLKNQEFNAPSFGKKPNQTKQSLPASSGRKMNQDNRKQNFRQKKLKRLRESAKQIRTNRLRSEMQNPSERSFKRRLLKKRPVKEKEPEKRQKEAETREPEKEKPKPRPSTEANEIEHPRRRLSTEVAKLGVIEKPYRKIILSRKAERSPTPPAMELTEQDRDDRELEEILKDRVGKTVERKRRGEPTFVPPFSSGDPRLDVMVNRTRQELMIYSRRTRFLESKVRILDRNVYWTPKAVERDGTVYREHILALDQISKTTRKSKTFSRLSCPTRDDILRARRMLGIDNADFNYADDEDETSVAVVTVSVPVAEKKLRRRRKEKSAGQHAPKRSKEFGGANAASRSVQINGVEFDIDNIESLVDNQPVDDSADSDVDDSWSDGARSETSPKWSGKYICGACGTSFPNKRGLELHEKKQLTCKPFSCKVCDRRFRSHKLCMKHLSLHGITKPATAKTSSSSSSSSVSGQTTNLISGRKVNFNCDQCGNSFLFTGINSYIKHREMVHPDQPAFKCSYIDCEQEFLTVVSLDMHLIRHNKNLQPWKCSKCHSRFVDVKKLKNHIINVHEMQKEMRKQYNMINVSKDMELEEDDYDIESMLIFDPDDQAPLEPENLEFKIESEQLGSKRTPVSDVIFAPVPLVAVDTVLGDVLVLQSPVEGLNVDKDQVQKELKAVNADLDVEVEYVDDIDALLDSEPELSEASLPESPIRPGKLKKTEATTQPEAPAKLAVVLPHVLEQLDEKEFYEEARSDLNESVGEDIEKIQNFLNTEVVVNESLGGMKEDQPSSENISDIQKFLQLSNFDHDDVTKSPSDVIKTPLDVIKTPLDVTKTADVPENSDENDIVITKEMVGKKDLPTSSFRIPRSPDFKKRLADKEIVSVKGIESLKEKKKPKKAKQISFEEQLKIADKVEKVAKEARTKKRSKATLKDHTITRKYAKLDVKNPAKLVEKISKSTLNPENKDEASVSVKEKSEVVYSKVQLPSDKHVLIKPVSLPQPPGNKSAMKVSNSMPKRSLTTKKNKPQPSVVSSKTSISAKAPESKDKTEVLIKMSKQRVFSKKSESETIARIQTLDAKPQPPSIKKSISESKLEPQTPPLKKSTSGPLFPNKLEVPKITKLNSLPAAAVVDSKMATKKVVHRSSIEAAKADKKIGPLSSYAAKGGKAREINPTEIDLERIIRQPSKLKVGTMHLKPPITARDSYSTNSSTSTSSVASSASVAVRTSTISTDSLKQALGNAKQDKKDDTERPRDPRLHSSKQLKSQAAQAEAKQAEDQANLTEATEKQAKYAEGPTKQELSQSDTQAKQAVETTKEPPTTAPVADQIPTKSFREPSKSTSSMGLPTPVPAASLSSEDEGHATPDRSEKPSNRDERATSRAADKVDAKRAQELDQGKGYYTERYQGEADETSQSSTASYKTAVYTTTASSSYTTASSVLTTASYSSSTTSGSLAAPPSFGAALISSAVHVVAAASKFPTLLPTNFPTFDSPGARKHKESGASSDVGSAARGATSSYPTAGALIQLTPDHRPHNTPVISTRPIQPPIFSRPGFGVTAPQLELPGMPTPGSMSNVSGSLIGMTGNIVKVSGSLVGMTSNASVSHLGVTGSTSNVSGSRGGMAESVSSLGVGFGGRSKPSAAAQTKPSIKLMLPKPVPASIASPVRSTKLSCHVCRAEFKNTSELSKHVCVAQTSS